MPSAYLHPDLLHGQLESIARLGLMDHLGIRTDHLALEFLKHPMLGQFHRDVQRRLATESRQNRIGPLPLDDLGHEFPRQRLDVGPVGQGRVGHDRRRIAVD